MSEHSQAFERQMQAVRMQYQSRLGLEIQALGEYLKCLQGGQGRHMLGESRALLHRMAGSAGTFGMEQLGRQAAQLEDLLTPYVTSERLPDDAQLQSLLLAYQALRAASVSSRRSSD